MEHTTYKPGRASFRHRLVDVFVYIVQPHARSRKKAAEPLYDRMVRFVNDAYRDGVIAERRREQALGMARKLCRFLQINRLEGISPAEFGPDLILLYRQFIFDEYLYAPRYPGLYSHGSGHRTPKKRACGSSVVQTLKALKAFFAELENAEEIDRSPFRRLPDSKKRSILRVMYDDPFFLRAEELRHLRTTAVPPALQWAKDLFVLNCALGCRIGDLLLLTRDNVAVSPDGIPYIHYIPAKTARRQSTNREIQTPLIAPALEIIKRTGMHFLHGSLNYTKQLYNKDLRELLRYCGLTRSVCVFNPEKGGNDYLPLCDVATSKLARKTHVDMLNKVQINYYVAGLHRAGSEAVFRYTSLELADRYELLKAAFGIKD